MTTRLSLVMCFVCAAALGMLPHAAFAQGIPCSYEIAHVIQAPPCGDTAQPTFALAISPGGRWVVGYHCACVCISDRAFVFDTTTGVFTTLPLPAGMTTSFAYDVNDAGQIVGHMGGTPGDFGFVYDIASGQYTLLPPAIAQDGTCSANGINASGVVCGTRTIGGPPGYPKTAFIWSEKDGFTDLGLIDGMSSHASDIADDGMVAVDAFGLEVYIWNGQQTIPIAALPGAHSISAHGIADDQHVVGTSLYISGPLTWAVPLEFRDGILEALPALADPNTSCTALAVTNTGLIVGGCRPLSTANWRPCAWLGGQIRDIESLITPVPGIAFENASAASEGGWIICRARSGADIVSIVLQPVVGTPGDTNCDATVNIDDLLTVMQWWGPGPSFADLNGDRSVNILDLLIIIEAWTF